MQRQFYTFLIRWALNSFGLWVAARLLMGHGVWYDETEGFVLFFWAGLVLSLVNAVLKPLIVVLSLPAILLTLGLFTLIVNGLTVWVASLLVPGFTVTFWAAVLAGMIISLINYVLTNLFELNKPGRSL
jgi:putative membrane protein